MKIATKLLKNAVVTVSKGMGNNAIMPLTTMVGLKLQDNILSLTTTDMTNTLVYRIDKVQGEDQNITVDGKLFVDLIKKMTSDTIELNILDDMLEVKGNGKYSLELITDENGLIEFPTVDIPDEQEEIVNLTTIMHVFNSNKPCLAKTLEMPELTGYYNGDITITTDATVICFNENKILNTNTLITAQMMNLLTLFEDEKINFIRDIKELVFFTDNMIVKGPDLSGIGDYPVDDIKGYLEENFDSSCKIPKSLLIDTLDRLTLFISPYDKNGAYFSFGRKGLNIHNKKDSSAETINYAESTNFNSFSCLVDIPLFKEQVQSINSDMIDLYYGNENALKMADGKVTKIVALLEEDED